MSTSGPLLSHARLDVYRSAIEFLGQTTKLLDSLPRGNAALADQLRRAALSVCLNIAEGAGKVSPVEKKKHYAIARGSALECSAILDCSLVLNLIEPDAAERGNAVLARIVSMLSKMAR